MHTWFQWPLSLAILAGSASAQIVINEIHHSPDPRQDPVEFIELYNATTNAISLAGWRLFGGVDFAFTEGTTIPPGGYQVVGGNPGALVKKYGVTNPLGPWQGRLNRSGESLRLYDESNRLVDEVDYALGFPWPTVGDPPGDSIELIHPSLDNSLGGNWRPSVKIVTTPTDQVVVPPAALWHYWTGPTAPPPTWRNLDFVDTAWSAGAAPLGYEDKVAPVLNTRVAGLKGNYLQVLLRTDFEQTTASTATSFRIKALYDDAFKVWLNGVPVGDVGLPAGDFPYGQAYPGAAREDDNYITFEFPLPAGALKVGKNVVSVQLANQALTSSDCFFDAQVSLVSAPQGRGPTPGQRNRVFALNAPPTLRQVTHTPQQPKADEPVRITVKATDPEGVAEVALEYQIIEPGNYLPLDNPAYTQGWQRLLMTLSTNDVYQATLPAEVQKHRRLIRYRLTATDAVGASMRAPLPDDSCPNFAYFVYNGVPAWTGAVRPGATSALGQEFTVSPEEMNRLPTFHLVAQKQAVFEATGWAPGSTLNQYRGDDYLWQGALIYDGQVYDHIRYRMRGGVWRYTMGKNAWKFDFNRGHELKMRDNYGHRFQVAWDKLSFRPDIQQGDYGHRGEQGLFESVGYRLFQLAGNAANNSVHVQFRIIEAPDEAPQGKQYDGDFWGKYLAVEEQDGTWLKERGLPDGNIYDMEGSFGLPNHLGREGPIDSSDLRTFLNAYGGNNYLNLSENWWRTNLDLRGYFGYQIILQGIHHYDIQDGKNYFYYRNPTSGQWSVQAWDLDLTWADSMYRGGKQSGFEPFLTPVLNGFNWTNPRLPNLHREFRNRVREVRDLLFNQDQAWQVIDEQALLIRGTNTPSFVDADRAHWDYNPVMSNASITLASKAGTGRFYQIGHGSKTFAGMVQLMKDYVSYRATDRGFSLDTMAAEADLPATPSLTYTGPVGYPENQLQFAASAFVGTGGFGSVQYRVAEVTRTNHPGYESGQPWRYEIETAWESAVMTTPTPLIHVPAGVLRTGKLHRARVRYLDAIGRASHWSEAVEFTTGEPDTAAALMAQLELTEIQYDPAPGGYEYLELHNRSTQEPLVLDGATFTAGINYTFPSGSVLAPNAFLVLARTSDLDGLRGFHNLRSEVPVLGPYSGSLANDADTITLRSAPAGSMIFSLRYTSAPPWPFPIGGTGRSLVPTVNSPPNSPLATNWRSSQLPQGSPGRAEPDTTIQLLFAAPQLANGRYRVNLTAPANLTYVVETSVDLGSWSGIVTNTGPSQLDEAVTPFTRYFRAVSR